MDEDIPIVATSRHVVVNTITAADDYLKMIQPSPSALPVYETNTYYSTVEFSKTINDDEITKVINTQDVITQVIVTESLPHGRMPMSMSHGIIDQSEEDELSPSDYNDEPEVHEIKKTNAIDVNPTRIEHKPSGNTGAIPLHLYATKTYLTTFTYFTTLQQQLAAGNGEISTTVNSHTRVIENVITESIASSMIPANILSSISKNLFEGEKNDLKTRIVLNNGHKLEITAANILKPIDYATKLPTVESNDLEAAGNELVSSSILLSSEENENLVSEQVSHEEDIQQQPIKLPVKHAKPKPVSSNLGSGSLKIPSLLNSISMPNFSALGPVINAMAGLLQTNFGSHTNSKLHVPAQLAQFQTPPKHRPIIVAHEDLPQAMPLFSQESQDLILSQTESKNTHPLYIPVHPNSNHHHHMMGSGIAISPGEIINANSDVIVGKPAVIGPKLPSNINKGVEIVGMEAPPPFVPLKTPQRPSSFVKDIKSNGNINLVTIKKGDDYIGPVPPKEIHIQQQQKPIPLSSYQRPPPQPQTLQKIPPIIPPMTRPQHNDAHHQRPQNNLQQMKPPSPTQESQINNNYVKINHQVNHHVAPNQHNHNKQNQNQQNFNRNPNGNFRNPEPPKHVYNGNVQVHNGHLKHQENHGHHHHHPVRQQLNENSNNKFHHQPHQNNPSANVIEIQRIPEVYSTDLPIITVENQHHFKPNAGSQIITHELPEILDKPTRGQPLLVDIQPSQVANVVIPHGSSSIFVFGGVHKAHKAGQYFNDPSPHGDAEVGIKSVNLHADIEGSKYQGQQQQNLNVHYDEKDNIIVASNNVPVPSPGAPEINVVIGNNIQPTYSRPPHDFLHHSVNVVPNTVIRFHPESGENYNRPSTQQLSNQQKQQLIQIDQQLKQKHAENQKRIEIENQKRQEFVQLQKLQQQKRKEFEEQQKRKEFEEQQHLKQIELDRKREYERQKQSEQEQRKKQMEQQKLELQKVEQQKRIQEQKLHQQYENQQRIQQEMKLRQQYEQQQKRQQEMRQKQQQQQNYNRQNIAPPSTRPESGFIILSSDYSQNNQNEPLSHQHGPFVPLPTHISPHGTPSVNEEDFENETDSDGQVVQESINRPKLPGGQSLDSIDDDVKAVEEYDNFVYHKITGSSTQSTERPETTSEKPATTSQTTRRSSYVAVSTERFVPTTERNGPIYKPKPYPNLQFDDLPKIVNDLQTPTRNHNVFQRLPNIKTPSTQNYKKGNTLSQAMQPPAPPKNSRRPTSPFHKTTFKISMPINPMPDDDNVMNLQTEEPFNPKYTEDYTTKPSLTTQVSSTQKTYSASPKTSTTTSTTTPSTTSTTTTERNSSNKNDLNIGEVEAKDRNKTSNSEDSELFDSKETINPHNHGFVNHVKDDMDLMPPAIRKPYHTINRVPESTTYASAGVRLEISSSGLENMKPPAPTFTRGQSHVPQFEEIINLKPPTEAPKDVDIPKLKPYVNIQRPTISLSRFTTTTPSSYVTMSRSKTTTQRPIHISRTTTSKPEIFDVVLHYKQGADKKEAIRNDEDMIIGSVEAVAHEHSYKNSINTTPILNVETTKMISTTPSLRPSVSLSSSVRQHVSFTRSRNPASVTSDDKKLTQNRTKAFLDPIKVSTKYITNTKTITLAKTKTEVINRSHGVPITTTRVQTATVFETITETETLLKPTIITSIHPTSTYAHTVVGSTAMKHHPTTTEEIIEGFVSEEDVEEFIINYDDNRNDTTINRVNEGEKPKNSNEHESIFVVMSDKKKGSIFNIAPSIINPSLHNHTAVNEIDDVSRGEEETNDGADHILLGGIFIASPPQLNKSHQGAAISSQCLPECKSSKNEYCHKVQGQMRCICRPGFARMFPDRPCKRK